MASHDHQNLNVQELDANSTQSPISPMTTGNHDIVIAASPQPIHSQTTADNSPSLPEKTQPHPDYSQQRQQQQYAPQYQPANPLAQPMPMQTAQYAVPLDSLPDQPQPVDCPFCGRRSMTRVEKEDSGTTAAAGILLCLVCICLACLPCIMGWAQNIDHFCGACGKQLTHRHHDGMTQVLPAARLAQQTRLQEQPAPPYQPRSEAQPQYQQQVASSPPPQEVPEMSRQQVWG